MRTITFLLIKPLKPVSFRWGGEFSPILSGPMNKGISEPLPLPSTIVGFLYSITKNAGNKINVNKLSLESDLNTVKVKLWGPLLYTKGGYYAHSYPGKVIKLNNWKIVEELDVVKVLNVINKIGIGIEGDSKTVKESLLYTQQLIKIKEGGIVVETDHEVKEGYYTMGGESSIVKVEVLKDLEIPQKGELGLVLSPIILKPVNKIVAIEDLYEMEIDGLGKLKDVMTDNLAIRIGLIGLGFNIAYGVRRPIYPAIMPGSIISYRERSNLGLFRENGWGSVLPISK
ncbi:hypothetical protein EWF20_00870 [Sulfolobus sp. S-194]|uniref:hypothetical protein n=1 Tax=Sulfolobus sp. S-194 TaxID=2512240 RepID=UPI001436F066|nr:hypothetical protein [Sulfolobus sp. S-194]QIW22850.1 hypothetical protein EWF20_00870 [Sulfolobus sp. S-194]